MFGINVRSEYRIVDEPTHAAVVNWNIHPEEINQDNYIFILYHRKLTDSIDVCFKTTDL